MTGTVYTCLHTNQSRSYLNHLVFPTRCNITQFIYFWKTALHVSGSISTHHQEHTQLYLQYLVLVNRYWYLPLLWESWSWSECGVGIVLICDVNTYDARTPEP